MPTVVDIRSGIDISLYVANSLHCNYWMPQQGSAVLFNKQKQCLSIPLRAITWTNAAIKRLISILIICLYYFFDHHIPFEHVNSLLIPVIVFVLFAWLEDQAFLGRAVRCSPIRGLALSGTKTHVKQHLPPLMPLLMVSGALWSLVLPAWRNITGHIDMSVAKRGEAYDIFIIQCLTLRPEMPAYK